MPPQRKKKSEGKAAINLRGIPIENFYRIKMAAAAEHKSVRELLMDLVEGKIQELEKKGVLAKGKR